MGREKGEGRRRRALRGVQKWKLRDTTDVFRNGGDGTGSKFLEYPVNYDRVPIL